MTEPMAVQIPSGFFDAEWVMVAALHSAPSFTLPQLVEVTPEVVRYSGLEVQGEGGRLVVDKPSVRPVQPGEFEELVTALVEGRPLLEAALDRKPAGGVAWALVVRWRSGAGVQELTFWTDEASQERPALLDLIDCVGKVAGVGLELFVEAES
ncbi:MAG: hypothetical protein QM765_42995 [Myxococcales bacterium]